ncbi:uncharacterized protein LOC113004589 isoform X1 [Solenopsis invicta]|uniref:uncharacterized protein LOC113004589 isoform X1 n=1 Tax=Solenopsis invicta TaxID=13686 RepID=UPI00193D433B|nr:uncharacterized protein LOC113004589 isoform X1 [Solenopsis invicta]
MYNDTSDKYELPEVVNLDTASCSNAQGFIFPSKLSSSYLCNDSQLQRPQPTTCILLEDASISSSDSSELTEKNVQVSNENSESNLKRYLQETSEGKIILSAYYNNNKTLNSVLRSRLVRLIIKGEKDRILSKISVADKLTNFVITTSRFQKLAGDIVKIFKGESCYTYYTPFTCKNGVRIQASGKLWEHYNYIKGDLRKQGILLQRSISKSIQETYAQTEIDEDKLQWLFHHTEPWEQVCEYWNNTYRARNKLLMQDKLNVLEYFNKFPCLQLSKGQHLLVEDFNRQYPEKESIFPKRWNIIKKVIIDQLQQLNKRLSVSDTALISILPAISSNKQDAVIFYLLPILIESRRAGGYKRKRNTNCEQDSENSIRKLTLQECRDAFMLHVQTVADLDRALYDLKRRLQRNKDTFQPTPLIVGPLVNIESSYVIVNDQKFKEDECWQLVILLKQIIDITTSSRVHCETYHLLDTIINEYLTLLNNQFPGKIKPKHHFLIHYARIMKLVGVLWKTNCMRYEGKHKEGKKTSQATNSRANISTIAIKHQLLLNYRLQYNISSCHLLTLGPVAQKNVREIPFVNNCTRITPFQVEFNILIAKWICYNNNIINKRAIIVTFNEEGVDFYFVHTIIINKEQNLLF